MEEGVFFERKVSDRYTVSITSERFILRKRGQLIQVDRNHISSLGLKRQRIKFLIVVSYILFIFSLGYLFVLYTLFGNTLFEGLNNIKFFLGGAFLFVLLYAVIAPTSFTLDTTSGKTVSFRTRNMKLAEEIAVNVRSKVG